MPLVSENPTYTVVYHAARWFADLFGRVDISGLENVPNTGCIIACNHQSFMDPPLVGCIIPKEIFFFARKTLFNNPLLGHILTTCNTIPVDRDGGSDVAAFKKVFSVLKSGHSLLMFPEGTRSKDGNLQEAKAGVGLIACKTQVPILPVRVFGAEKLLPRGSSLPRPSARVSVIFRKPLFPAEFDPGAKHPERFLEASRRVMEKIASAEELPDVIL
ncbi:MAG: 1-acyl-sn-glycerol-3-phosphate acyltransferase [Puniceicoccales bacterium]|jgi:1-acyl-sn-glycerol-3-phosphate acyltransferase|nr:1-acyl-sn-glycerol-3-phosphate acyltransferase [Puniceicoccales bacterium]